MKKILNQATLKSRSSLGKGTEQKKCIICDTIFSKKDRGSSMDWVKIKCCSYECSIKSRKGRKHTKETKNKMSKAHAGITVSEKTKKLIKKNHARYWLGKKNIKITGDKSYMWKGDNIKYQAIHVRIRKKLGTPNYCEICKKTDKKKYVWSNKDHKYNLKTKDWQRLCESCHQKYDKNKFIRKTSRG